MKLLYIKPENALQRAEELLEVNAPTEALNVLSETLQSKKSRGAAITSLEPLALKLIELSVELKRNRVAREGLHSYKNLVQNTSVTSVEKVVRRFLECSEAKLKEAQDAKAEANPTQDTKNLSAEEIDDLETPDTYESVLTKLLKAFEESDEDITVVSDIPNREPRDKDEVTPRLKFLWDAYRTVLDVLRNNARLELLYQQTVAQAFAFCVRYSRKNEFRRLCDTLRMHLANLPRQVNANYAINLSDPDVLQRFLDTRFLQLQTATDLELWQEGFKSAEDIYQLLVLAGSLIVPSSSNAPQAMAGLLPAAIFTHKRHGSKMMQMVAQYYEKMTRIFSVSGDGLFLAASWNKYFSWIMNMKGSSSLSDQEQRNLAIHALLSALATPIFQDQVDPEAYVFRFNRKNRLSVMLGLQGVPDRKSLLQEAASKSVMSRVPNAVRELYEAMEVNFHPLAVSSKIRSLLSQIEANAEFAKYVQPIKSVVISKILKNLSNMYSTITFDSMIEVTTVGSKATDLFTLEQLIMQGNQKGEFSIKANYLTRTFDSIPLKVASPDLAQLMNLPIFSKLVEKEKVLVFDRANQFMEDEHLAVLSRLEVIEQKKEDLERIQRLKAKEEEEARQKRIREEREALQKKLADEAKQRELDRLRKEQEEIKKQEARKIAEALKAKSGVTIADEDLDEMDTTAIFALQAEQSRKEKEALESKMAGVIKRMDYMERAVRKEEIPLLEMANEEQKVLDKQAFEDARKRAVEEAKERHATAVTIKHRVQRMMPDYIAFRDRLISANEEKVIAEQREAEKRIAHAIEQRRKEVRELILQRIAAKEEEERRRVQREKEAEERRLEAEEREEQRRKVAEAQAELAAKQLETESRGWRPSSTATKSDETMGWTPKPKAMVVQNPRAADWTPGASSAGWTPPTKSSDMSRARMETPKPSSDRGSWRREADLPPPSTPLRSMVGMDASDRSTSKSDQGVSRGKGFTSRAPPLGDIMSAPQWRSSGTPPPPNEKPKAHERDTWLRK